MPHCAAVLHRSVPHWHAALLLRKSNPLQKWLPAKNAEAIPWLPIMPLHDGLHAWEAFGFDVNFTYEVSVGAPPKTVFRYPSTFQDDVETADITLEAEALEQQLEGCFNIQPEARTRVDDVQESLLAHRTFLMDNVMQTSVQKMSLGPSDPHCVGSCLLQ